METKPDSVLSLVTVHREKLGKGNQEYLQSHPETSEILNDLARELFMQKPANVSTFIKDYFATWTPKKQLFRPIVLSGPSGVGKGTLIDMLFKEYPGTFAKTISYTTRPPRPGELHGREYYFVSEELFTQMVSEDKFLEHCCVHGKHYGTAKSELDRIAKLKQICILEIDVQGAQKVYKANVGAYFLFVYPPTIETVRERLKKRGTETEAVAKLRVENALKEVEFANDSTLYKYRIVNDKLDVAFEDLVNVLKLIYQEELKGLAKPTASLGTTI